jgi:hypothetical protein
MKFILALTLLMLADAVSTVFLVKFGPCNEVNPIAAWGLSIGAIFFISAKTMIGLLAGVGLAYCVAYKRGWGKSIQFVRYLMVMIYGILMVWHVLCWLAVYGGKDYGTVENGTR